VQKDNRKTLFLTLADDAKEELNKFTPRNLNQLTSIEVNVKAITKHKI